MSQIHLARNNVVLGQFTEAEITAGLQAGTYLPTDLAWRSGMAQWKPLSEWSEFGGTATTTPTYFEVNPGMNAVETQPAWENRGSTGLIAAYFATVKQVITAPGRTFNNLKQDDAIGPAFVFYFIGQVAVAICAAIAGSINPQPFEKFLPHPAGAAHTNPFGNISPAAAVLMQFVGGIFCTPIAIFVYTAILHLMLMLWRAQTRPFAASYRAYAYVSGAFCLIFAPLNLLMATPITAILAMVVIFPLCAWMFVLHIIALSGAHRAPVIKVVAAYLTPLLLCCCAYLAFAFLIFGAVAAGSHH